MRRFDWAIRALAGLILVLSLGSAPVLDASTHGPGTLVVEADHAAFHAVQGETSQPDSHEHHDSTDHDHAMSVMLASQRTEVLDMGMAVEFGDLPVLSGAIRDGPRRPPRVTV